MTRKTKCIDIFVIWFKLFFFFLFSQYYNYIDNMFLLMIKLTNNKPSFSLCINANHGFNDKASRIVIHGITGIFFIIPWINWWQRLEMACCNFCWIHVYNVSGFTANIPHIHSNNNNNNNISSNVRPPSWYAISKSGYNLLRSTEIWCNYDCDCRWIAFCCSDCDCCFLCSCTCCDTSCWIVRQNKYIFLCFDVAIDCNVRNCLSSSWNIVYCW